MTQRVEAPPEFAGTLFDVTIMLPEGKRTTDIDPMSLQAAGIPAQHLDHLIRLLGAGQPAKVKGAVPWARATQIGERFGRTGVNVAISRSLSIRTLASDGLETCPACDVRVKMPANRQCPACKVFVDRMSPEFAEQRKLADSVRAVREAEEATSNAQKAEKQRLDALIGEYHASIFRELGPEYELVRKRGLFEGTRGKLRAVGVVALLGAVFAGGYELSANFVHGAKPEPGATEPPLVAAINQLLEQVGLKSARTEPVSGPLVSTPVESLLRGPDGARVTLRGLGLERAVEAVLNPAAAPRAEAGAESKPAVPAISIPMEAKLLLASDFARSLAEMGQTERAKDIIRALKDTPELGMDAAASAAVRMADMEVQAWSISLLSDAHARPAAALLKQAVTAISDPTERVVTLSRVGAILGQQGQLPPEIARGFLAQASESANAIPVAKLRAAALGEWVVATAEIHATESTAQAKAGLHGPARAGAEQVERLVRQAPDDRSRVRQLAIDYRLRQQVGDTEKAAASLDAAIALITKIDNLAERTAALRTISQIAGIGAAERIQLAVTAIEPLLETKTGIERARSLANLALLNAEQGQTARADRYAQLARTSPSLSPADAIAVTADLLMQREVTAAKVQQAGGRFADADQGLRRVGGYLR